MKACDIVEDKSLYAKAVEKGFNKIISARDSSVRKGGTLELNRKIVRSKTRVLMDPVSAKDRAFDTAVAQIAKDNDVAVAFSLKSVAESRGIDRVRLLRNIFFAVEICRKMGNNVMIVSGASDVFEMKQPVLLVAFGQLIGLSKAQAKWAVSEAYRGVL